MLQFHADLVLASGSGLDRYISVESAMIQVPRIAKERNLSESVVNDLILKNEEIPFPGIGQPIVNVLETKYSPRWNPLMDSSQIFFIYILSKNFKLNPFKNI